MLWMKRGTEAGGKLRCSLGKMRVVKVGRSRNEAGKQQAGGVGTRKRVRNVHTSASIK